MLWLPAAAIASTILSVIDWRVVTTWPVESSRTSSTFSVVVSGNSVSSELSHLATLAAFDGHLASSVLHVTSSAGSGSTLILTLAAFLTDDDVGTRAADVLRRFRTLCTVYTHKHDDIRCQYSASRGVDGFGRELSPRLSSLYTRTHQEMR